MKQPPLLPTNNAAIIYFSFLKSPVWKMGYYRRTQEPTFWQPPAYICIYIHISKCIYIYTYSKFIYTHISKFIYIIKIKEIIIIMIIKILSTVKETRGSQLLFTRQKWSEFSEDEKTPKLLRFSVLLKLQSLHCSACPILSNFDAEQKSSIISESSEDLHDI